VDPYGFISATQPTVPPLAQLKKNPKKETFEKKKSEKMF